ncbi:MAG: hypothetical protein HC916_18585 [Coleofasciculaceae cyanobacterium SM2_1_6]|nr:hypothetical protein [Coleofasciculaceae cyanobacterium SM2_1_6]
MTENLDELKKKAITLYQSGKSLKAIGQEVRRSPVRVREWLIAAGVERRKNTEATLSLIIPLTPQLAVIPPDQRKEFCLAAITEALKNLPD